MNIRLLPLAAAVTSMVAAAVALLPREATYDRGFAPPWVTVVGAGLALVFLWLGRRRRAAPLGWGGAVLLLWAGGGVVLDLFRAFFWATGIPAGSFARVAWLGAVTRALGLVAAGLVAAAVLRHRRATREGCVACGRTVPAREPVTWPGGLAFALCFPYPLLKLYWSLGGTIGRPAVYGEGFPYMEMTMLVGGAVLSLALVQRWGRAVPRPVLLVPAWGAVAALVSMGALAGFGTLSEALGLSDGPVDFTDTRSLSIVGTVYASWLLLGLALGGATLAYQRRTRRPCSACAN
jgi:hypothetical protein